MRFDMRNHLYRVYYGLVRATLDGPDGAPPGAALDHSAPAVALVLTLRANMAFSRWWEARGALGLINLTVRQISWMVIAPPKDDADQETRSGFVKILLEVYPTLLYRLHPDEPETTPPGTFLTGWRLSHLERNDFNPTIVTQLLQWHAEDVLQSGQMHMTGDNYRVLCDRIRELHEGISTCLKIVDTVVNPLYDFILSFLVTLYGVFWYPQFSTFALTQGMSPEMVVGTLATSGGAMIMLSLINFMVSLLMFGLLIIIQQTNDPYGDDVGDLPVHKFQKALHKELLESCHLRDLHLDDCPSPTGPPSP